jgi:hypothetical protein
MESTYNIVHLSLLSGYLHSNCHAVFQKTTIQTSLFVICLCHHFCYSYHLLVHSFGEYFFYIPNFLYLAGPLPFLLGPLLYFYFKTSWAEHELNFWELLHLIPTVFTALYLWPFINETKSEKFIAFSILVLILGCQKESDAKTNFDCSEGLIKLNALRDRYDEATEVTIDLCSAYRNALSLYIEHCESTPFLIQELDAINCSGQNN